MGGISRVAASQFPIDGGGGKRGDGNCGRGVGAVAFGHVRTSVCCMVWLFVDLCECEHPPSFLLHFALFCSCLALE